MIAGNLTGSVVSGLLISRTGKWKGYLVGGTVLLIGGLALAGTMDHTTELWQAGIFTAILGLGLGMLMQNLVLAVQNTVRAQDIGTASASVAFFRSVGGAIGVSVLGAVLANRVNELATRGTGAAGIPVAGGNSGGHAGPGGHARPGPRNHAGRLRRRHCRGLPDLRRRGRGCPDRRAVHQGAAAARAPWTSPPKHRSRPTPPAKPE